MSLTKRQKKRILSLILALLTLLVGFLTEHNSQIQEKVTPLSPGTYRITRFSDGDTISVDMDGTEEEIRFIGVDTPETQDPRKPVQCFGKSASAFTRQLIGDQAVRLEADTLSSNRDRYGRLLRYVYLPDGRLVQAEIIKAGYGFAYISFPFAKLEEFSTYQREAREQEKGLWKDCSPAENDFGSYTSNDAN